MSFFRPFLSRFQATFQKRRLEAEMAEEMQHHLELRQERNIAQGMSAAEAHLLARRQFGNVGSVQEQARDQQRWRLLEDFLQDFRYATRRLVKRPGFTLAAVTVLALGIGANAAIFDFVHSLLLAPLTYVRPDEVMRVISQDKRDARRTRNFSYETYRHIRAHNTIFSDTLALADLTVGLGDKGDLHRVVAAAVSSNYFSVLGVTPFMGRGFLPLEETPGSAHSVVVVSYNFLGKHRFDPALLGSTLKINGHAFTVIGIMPDRFTGTTALFYTDIWFPLGDYDLITNLSGGPLAAQATTALTVLGRRQPGLTSPMAELAFKTFSTDFEKEFPAAQKDQVLVLAQHSRFASHANDVAVSWVGALLLGMAAIVLLVACLNLANMLLARGTARRKELALRLALGGSRGRIVRQLLTEGFLLALLGGIGGLLLALWSSSLLISSLEKMIPIELVWTAAPQPALLGATFIFSLLATLTFALGPSLIQSRGDVMAHLKEHAGEDVARRRWKLLPRNPLVSLQIALSLALLTAAALFIRSAANSRSADVGLKADRVFLVEIDASLAGRDQKSAQTLYQNLIERFAALPGVESASVAVDVPLGGLDLEKRVQRTGDASSAIGAKWNGVGADYFKTVGLPLLRGRSFTLNEASQTGSPPTVVINELLANRLWPQGDALGQRLQLSGDEATSLSSSQKDHPALPGSELKPGEMLEVVGIVPAVRHTLFEPKPEDPAIYLPYARGFQSHVFFHVKFASLLPSREAATADILRRAVSDTDPSLPILSLESFSHHLDNNIQIWIVRAGAALFSTFGGLALCLAVVGIYSVVAYSVARRTREIGIRMALGAQPDAVQRLILREGAVMLTSGLALGLLLALGIGKIMSSILYQVSARDPIAFTVAPGVLAIAAFLACWLPARRATKVDPMVALRAE